MAPPRPWPWVPSAIFLGLLAPRRSSANWLLQCSSCVDQAHFSDDNLKENIKDVDTSALLAQIKRLRVREFDHREDEFYNKFFSKRQLGIVAQEAQSVMPGAVAHVPERRWTTAKGMSNVTKNVMLLRDSHLLYATVASIQLLAKKADYWDATIDRLDKEMVDVIKEQNHNRKKREDMLEQMVRIIAKVEVLQHNLAETSEKFLTLDRDVAQFREEQVANHTSIQHGLEGLTDRVHAQDAAIDDFKREFQEAVSREARADLVEKRKAAEADLEIQLVKRSIEKLRWEEEQKTIQMRADEQRRSEDHSSKLHQDRVAHELAQKKLADLELMEKQEESNLRQEAAKREGERELLLLKLASEEKRAEMGVQEAIERAKVEQEAKIRERRENEDVHLRHMKAEQQEKRQQTLAAIKASAEIVHGWVTSVYASPQNLFLAIGSIVAAISGAFLAREMAILLREQLNKRLGKPSLVRKTNRRGMLQQASISVLRFLRLRPPHGAEFNDVVLHPPLQEQVMRLAEATRSAKRRRMPLQHIMFYGPPGTGKTMVAERFAEYSGLEYAIMSGGDVAPLQEQGVTELHKLFKWVHRSKRGVLLFIDEADAFLASRKRGTMSEPLRNALTTMLYHTGTPSSQFMMVLATNRPGDLDSAVLDRIDESVEFGLPDVDAREGMVNLYFKMYIAAPLNISLLAADEDPNAKVGAEAQGLRRLCCRCPRASVMAESPKGVRLRSEDLVDKAALRQVAQRLHGFSGREIAKLFTSLQTHVLFSSGRGIVKRYLPKALVFEVVEQKAVEHSRTADFQEKGYNYVHNEDANCTETLMNNMSLIRDRLTPKGSLRPEHLLKPNEAA